MQPDHYLILKAIVDGLKQAVPGITNDKLRTAVRIKAKKIGNPVTISEVELRQFFIDVKIY
jgi:hypothetical protein